MWNFKEFGNRCAIINEFEDAVTYNKLSLEEIKFRNAVGGRCLVFILSTNSIGSLLGYVSCLNGNIVPLMLNAHLEQEILDNLLNLYHPSYIWLPEENAEQFKGLSEVYSSYGYKLLQTNYGNNYPLYAELALLLTTSGSTGSPKFVKQSYDNIEANTKSIAGYLHLDETERAITTLPMNYTYGLSIINTHLAVGAAILVTDKGLMQKEFWNFFKEQKATSFGGVPYTYEMLDRLKIYRMDLPSLKTMTQAGGKLTPELHEKFANFAWDTGRSFVVMYGQCEATARMGYLPANKAVEKKGSMGIAIPGGKLRLIDVDGNEIRKPHTTGKLVYEGANVTLGYAECGDDLIKGDERGGVLQTGDMAQFDEDGYFYIVGRRKRFLKIYGNRVNLDEIDRMIKSAYEDIDVASTGVDDHMYLFPTKQEMADEIKNFVVSKTRLNPAAFKTICIPEIPKNDAGKTLYKDLEKYCEEN